MANLQGVLVHIVLFQLVSVPVTVDAVVEDGPGAEGEGSGARPGGGGLLLVHLHLPSTPALPAHNLLVRRKFVLHKELVRSKQPLPMRHFVCLSVHSLSKKHVQDVQEKLCFFINPSLSPSYRCKIFSKLSMQCECTVTPICWPSWLISVQPLATQGLQNNEASWEKTTSMNI